MALIFPKWTNDIPRIGAPVVAVLGGFAIFVVWYWFSPMHTDVGYQPTQPIHYSHKLHAGELGLDCRYCHNNVERTFSAGVPPTQTCMNCHKQVKKDSPRLAALRESWGDGTAAGDGGPIPWKRIHKVADYVYFPHSAHTNIVHQDVAVGCTTCHGRIDEMVVVHQVQPLSMSWCLDCHNNPAPNLRPRSELTNMAWTPDEAWLKVAAEKATHLEPPGHKNARTVVPEAVCATHADEETCAEAHCNWDGEKCHEGFYVRATAGCTGCHR